MKGILYLIIGVSITFIVLFGSISIGNATGLGTIEIGISLLCGIVVACTFMIIDVIEKNNGT